MFDAVGGVAETGSVGEEDGQTVEGSEFGDDVSGGTGNGCDDGAVVADQGVEEAALADIGGAENGQTRRLLEPAAGRFVGGEETGELVAGGAGWQSFYFAERGGEAGGLVENEKSGAESGETGDEEGGFGRDGERGRRNDFLFESLFFMATLRVTMPPSGWRIG